MALAGAERIFNLIDEKPEVDDGYVTLENAIEEDGEIKPVKRNVQELGLGDIHIKRKEL